MDVFVNQRRDVFIQRVLELHSVLDVIVREIQPIVRSWPCRFAEVETKPYFSQVLDANGDNGQERNRHRDLRLDR